MQNKAMNPPPPDAPDKRPVRYFWTFSTYFAEGFPFVIIRTISAVFFRDMKVSLENVGLTSLYGLPWIFKFLWGPQVDSYSTKRRWMLTMQTLLTVMMALAAFIIPLGNNVQWIAILFLIGAFIASTHDVSIDGYYMEALDKDDQAKFVGVRAMGFRIAMLTGTAVVASIGTNLGWRLAFLSAAFIFGLFLVTHFLILLEVETIRKKTSELFIRLLEPRTLVVILAFVTVAAGVYLFFKSPFYTALESQSEFLKKISFSHWITLLLLLTLIMVALFRRRLKDLVMKNPDSFYSKAFISFMDREKIGVILFFIILLRAGEWAVTTMVSPFILDLGIKKYYGLISGIGFPSAMAGALLGGWLISRYGLKRLIWPFIMAQNLTNIIYMFLAAHLTSFLQLNTGMDNPTPVGGLNIVLVISVHTFDQFASGLGNAVLMTYLMRICSDKFKATHYAIGSGLMNLSGLFAGISSGIIAGWLGYAWLFGLSFVASIPAMLAIPFLPHLDHAPDHPPQD